MADLMLSGVSIARGAGLILRGVDFAIATGDRIALVGRNGAGKSTLLETIAGLLAPSEGTITLDGRSLQGRGATATARAGVVLVPQGKRLFGRMTVADNLAVGALRSHWWWNAPPASAFETVWSLFPDLYELRDRRADRLSGGQQQMVAIGRALMAGPKVLMLDEPTFGLSPQMAERICLHLEQIASADLTILVAEQNIDVAVDIAPSMAILSGGTIVAFGPKEEAMKSPHFVGAMYG
jgi:branched-chain amino acid transport system ATP-binding protein